MRIRERVALVTGASSGIGWETAVLLAERGAKLVVHGRDERRLAELSARTGAIAVVADLARPDELNRLVQQAQAAHGRIDLLVNNAGLGWAGPFAAMPQRDIAELSAVNLGAPIALTRAVLPDMIERGYGHLMFVSSIVARTAVAGEALYAGTKSGLDTFAASLRMELRGTGVGVGVVVPGVVDTAFFERRGRTYGRRRPRPLEPAAVADALVRAVERDRPEVYRPAWLRWPVAVRGAAPATYLRLAARFGGQTEYGQTE
ncbi:SDR family NAD(P)-dependent oxidoreductase [Rhodococcus sp. D2-41]|uniref:SDR family NAD(P)-dependent oxidoreductase n=1 Tax=Speluncibacter jeojiensis TaxID=2710754 RepID=A0A9X4RDT3_9ACTN|nr:SDR family NAD(P)-dependent oxidoreductase [Rhodococcus sp. D2-41]MDG3011474.1 SDR family NAD(P)-dependent oxidoreductase [Rhodococcus sp. D2-41]MDG3015170.1 SDR family NAD(P)-dependent oxidoreductase [Corynebacteriales bacterium D3-21]